ncbi:Protein CBG27193 [Caenorhabditis briggsae]|uniref:Protein CBG27193 n=1 Tax=Caenorhabditis briggsae TaxID=6238 RepID=B6IL23_CAEBR|nr:Protein CBG27193 [Caenorhabditis briggsae]CAS00656.1 Protein CBG27193 [Caenorhabditis briggsae]
MLFRGQLFCKNIMRRREEEEIGIYFLLKSVAIRKIISVEVEVKTRRQRMKNLRFESHRLNGGAAEAEFNFVFLYLWQRKKLVGSRRLYSFCCKLFSQCSFQQLSSCLSSIFLSGFLLHISLSF